MLTRAFRKNLSQQARIRISAKLFVLTLLLAPILFLASPGQVPSAEAAGTNGSSIWLDGPTQATQGETLSYDIKTDAGGLYGLQLEINFDPTILQVVDTQLTPGSCPQTDFVQANNINNTTGFIEYVVVQLHPTAPCDGGIVASFQFEVSSTAALGNSAVQFGKAILADKDGTEIPSTAVDLDLEIVGIKADFSGTPATGFAPLTVNFTNLSSGDYDTCTWDFGDSSGSSLCSDQSHVYTAPGTYTVSLSISGPSGNDSQTKVGYINVVVKYDLYLPVILADYP